MAAEKLATAAKIDSICYINALAPTPYYFCLLYTSDAADE